MGGALYLTNVSVHLFAALLWLGGMFFFALVGAPVLRGVEPPALRAELFRKLGQRFLGVAWASIAVLLVTGTLNLHFRGLLGWDTLGSGAFWALPYGRALAWKLGAVGVMLVVSVLHDFWLGPAASRLRPGTPAALTARRRASWLARGNALAGVVAVLAAGRLARGG
jgi:copper resistance protein D